MAPCVSLNLYNRVGRAELRFFAFFGILLQCTVLVWDGYATYIKRYTKGAAEVNNYTFSITCAGTLTLVTGMFICSWMIDRSTIETIYKTTDAESVLHMLWLQKTCTVSDQIFKSHAIFANGERPLVAMSQRRHLEDPESWGGKPCTVLKDELWTTIGVLISITGFIAQFLGLRTMHWSAALAQFGATFIMAGVRAWVRRAPSAPPYAIELFPNHELDWLATRASDQKSLDMLWTPPNAPPCKRGLSEPHPTCSSQNPTDELFNKDQTFWTPKCLEWGIQTGGTIESYQDLRKRYFSANAQKILETRIRLGQLTHWPGCAVQVAISVATAIDLAMKALYKKQASDGDVVKWFMHTRDGEAIQFSIKYCNGTWISNLAEIDSALSLWLFSVHDKERNNSSNEDGDDESTWLRTSVMGKRKALRLLGPISPALRNDMEWWNSSGVDQVLEVVDLFSHESETLPEDHCWRKKKANSVMTIETHRVVGPTQWGKPKPTLAGPIPRYQSMLILNSPTSHDAEDSGGGSGHAKTFAIQSNAPLPHLYGQEIFSAFLWTVAAEFGPIVGSKSPSARDAPWDSFNLESDPLLQLAKDIRDNGLGHLQDVFMILLPPLSYHAKLDSSVIEDLAIEQARVYELERQWKMAAMCLFRALPLSLKFRSRENPGTRMVFVILELQARLADTISFQKMVPQQGAGLSFTRAVPNEELEPMYSETEKLLKHFVTPRTLIKLTNLYKSQSQARRSDTAETYKMAGCLGWEEVHYAVMRGEWRIVLQTLKQERTQLFQDFGGWTPFHYCFSVESRGKNSEQLKEINSKMNAAILGCQTHAGLTVLHCAATKLCAELFPKLVKKYIQTGVSIDTQDNRGMTPLHWAAMSGRPDTVLVLSRAHASTNIRQENGFTPLHCIAFSDRPIEDITVCIEELLSHGADKDAKDDSSRTALYLAVAMKKDSLVEVLLRKGASLTKDLYTVCGPKDRILVLLLERQFQEKNSGTPPPSGCLPLHLAIMCDDWSTVDILVEKNADPHETSNNGTTLFTLCSKYDFYPSRLGPLFNVNAVDPLGKSFLHHAVESKNISNVKRLLEAGINRGLKDHSS